MRGRGVVTGGAAVGRRGRIRAAGRQALQQLGDAPLAEPARLVGLAVLVGVVGGLGALVFRWLIHVFRMFFIGFLLGPGAGWPPAVQADLRFLAPVLGLLLVGVITTYLASEVKGHGVPQILEALALRGGRIRPRVALFGILAPAITIGAEGSVGREGPIALIGAAFGSLIGQILRLADQQTSLLVACGAAAGIGATFNAPVAGALFGLEIVLGSYAMGALVPCFVASVTGVTLFDWIHGSQPVLPTPSFQFVHPFGVVFMLPLGLLAGGVALAYTRGLNLVEDLHERLHWGFAGKAVVGGLAVGLVGFALPQVLGVGYAPMEAAAAGRVVVGTLVLLLIGKYVATLLTIGSGGSGGVFAPSLYLGVMLGGAYGGLLHGWLPGYTSPAPLYAVAGMGAVFAAAAQAPLTAATIILEMTGDYRLVTGVMAACAVSYLFYGSLARDSMYTVRLTRRGIQILRGAEVRPLQRVSVEAAMDRQVMRLDLRDSAEHAYQELAARGARGALVLDEAGGLWGVLDGEQAVGAAGSARDARTVGELARRDVPVLTPESSLDDAMRRFGILNTNLIPVVADKQATQILGAVTQEAVLKAYYRHTVLTMELQSRLDLVPKERHRQEGRFREITLPLTWSPGRGVRVAVIGANLPRGVVLVAVTRGEDEIVVRGETELRGGDRVLLYAAEEGHLTAAERILQQGPSMPRRGRGTFETIVVGWKPNTEVPVRNLGLPRDVLLVSLVRGETTLVPTGSTKLVPGDVVVLYATDTERLAAAVHLLAEGPAGPAPGPEAASP